MCPSKLSRHTSCPSSCSTKKVYVRKRAFGPSLAVFFTSLLESQVLWFSRDKKTLESVMTGNIFFASISCTETISLRRLTCIFRIAHRLWLLAFQCHHEKKCRCDKSRSQRDFVESRGIFKMFACESLVICSQCCHTFLERWRRTQEEEHKKNKKNMNREKHKRDTRETQLSFETLFCHIIVVTNVVIFRYKFALPLLVSLLLFLNQESLQSSCIMRKQDWRQTEDILEQ